VVVTVETSLAHVAGALGAPVWLAVSAAAHFIWMLDRDDSPWYQTMRLFRQDESRDYASVLARVRAELQSRIAAFKR
jgi:ADP-heptose:LPS heptosyltransferase